MGDRQNGENLLPRGYPRRRAVRHGGANPSTKGLSPPTCRQARRRQSFHQVAIPADVPSGQEAMLPPRRGFFSYRRIDSFVDRQKPFSL